MTDATLECPASAGDLYLAARAEDVEPARPILTGDILDGVEIPGLQSIGLAIVLTHPCSMRRDGANLADRLLMARVNESNNIPLQQWSVGHFKVMPLPELMGSHHSAFFDEIGLVATDRLDLSKRVACLTPFGINLMQQRFIWHLTRFLAPTHRLGEASEAVFAEADLCEEWSAFFAEKGQAPAESATTFHEWIRDDAGGGDSRQQLLESPQRRAGVRRAMREHLRGPR